MADLRSLSCSFDVITHLFLIVTHIWRLAILLCHIWAYRTMVKNPLMNDPDQDHLRGGTTYWYNSSCKKIQVNRSKSFWVMHTDRPTERPKCTALTLSSRSESNRLRGRVVKGVVGHLDHVWSYGVREVVSSIPDRGNIAGWVFHPTRTLVRFSHLNMPFLQNSEFI